MIEPTPINIVRLLLFLGAMFFWGMSTDVSDEMRERARVLWLVLLGVIWVIAFVTGGWN